MDEPFLSGGGDGDGDGGADQAISEATESLQRSSSLLERINAQREREARSTEDHVVATGASTDVEMDSHGLPVTNYSPIANDEVSGGYGGGAGTTGGINLNPFGSGFSGFSGMSISLPQMGLSSQQDQSSESLLSEQVGSLNREYSMTAYFKMFVIDIYSLFRSMPVPAQIFTVVFLIWILWKLI
jgi:hypothetical protein